LKSGILNLLEPSTLLLYVVRLDGIRTEKTLLKEKLEEDDESDFSNMDVTRMGICCVESQGQTQRDIALKNTDDPTHN
jgi:hypothetical protein